MTGAAGTAVPGAALDFLDDLQPLDWIVIGAAAVCLGVLVSEWRRGRGPLTPKPDLWDVTADEMDVAFPDDHPLPGEV